MSGITLFSCSQWTSLTSRNCDSIDLCSIQSSESSVVLWRTRFVCAHRDLIVVSYAVHMSRTMTDIHYPLVVCGSIKNKLIIRKMFHWTYRRGQLHRDTFARQITVFILLHDAHQISLERGIVANFDGDVLTGITEKIIKSPPATRHLISFDGIITRQPSSNIRTLSSRLAILFDLFRGRTVARNQLQSGSVIEESIPQYIDGQTMTASTEIAY